MKFGVLGLGVATAVAILVGQPGAALAEPPKAKTGFQMAIRTGYSAPFGEIVKDTDLSDFSSGQVPLIVDIGGKVIPQLFLGGYVGFGFGGPGGNQADICDRNNSTCFGFGLRFGAEAQVHFIPDGFANPWLGYGIGFESLALAVDNSRNDDVIAAGVGGWEYAHFMGGVDFRLNRIVGIGPFVDVSLGSYRTVSYDNGNTTRSSDIDDAERAMHGWATFGVRVVFFP